MKCPNNPMHKVHYSGSYDAYYCVACNVWLEKKCKDEKCRHCSTRPETPWPIELESPADLFCGV